ncbi:DNA-binding transcriptional regulator, MarR family [Duganella sp. CF517]|uniref:MarR family winged helix-turn-helix transcriptional regulator n=1 Tax=Duganella sp. CF517 TaxID=1881038 RepID=UPI0008BCCCB3|nr:MarR family winged helix-turn-helix transcriptional regulator [Duganella sp. CF517]SEO09277.1 DNA-binding transcriptional regulator, MarR family [Duganella sp. CF517]
MAKKSPTPAPPAPTPLDLERADGLAADPHNIWRHDNIGRLALFCFNHLEARMLQKLATQAPDLRQTHLRIFRHIDFGGTRVTEIAARAKVTKGAMSQALADCERLGYLAARPDDGDARARVVDFTAKGRKAMATCRKAISETEAEFEAAIGVEKYALLKTLLLEIRSGLQAADDAAGP